MITRFIDPFDALLGLQRGLEACVASDSLQDATASRGRFPPINVCRGRLRRIDFSNYQDLVPLYTEYNVGNYARNFLQRH